MRRPPVRSVAALLASAFALGTTASLPPDANAADPPPQELLGLPLLYADDFESGKMDRWEPSDPTGWKVTVDKGNKVLDQHKKQSNFKPPVRSPFNRALLRDLNVGDFVLDARVKSTHPDYGHRDMCLFFGYQDDSHLYYVHFGKKADDHANQIFVVKEAPRLKISTKTTDGTNWDDEWHHVRVVRNAVTGSIDVYFDDMNTPVMTAVDKSFAWGRVGLGSFDDTGWFDDVRVYGRKVEPPKK
jgi:hypothetical protein